MDQTVVKKPLEFIITRENEGITVTIFYSDNTKRVMAIPELPEGFILGRHYSITDLYGYVVIDDRKGL